ncbi:MAG TPA: ABC transporter permease [Bryobacteraceae bacterium]|jgi:putative ABC transport system permease protein|nr:ABC transporter permease [Bryobacteraceae bacterium]
MHMLSYLIQDLFYAGRILARRPGFAVAAILSLALGIGVTTAIFTVVNAVALRPLPYSDPDRLVWMTQLLHGSSTDEVTFTPHFLEWRRQNQTFAGLAAYNSQTRNLTGTEAPIEVHTARASAALLPLLGVEPAIGRNFTTGEDAKGHDRVAILTDQLWQRQFGADPKIAGRPIMLDGDQYIVTGVLPRSFVFPGLDAVDLLTPLAKDEAAELQFHDSVTIIRNVVGRLKPGVTPEQANADLMVIQARLPLPPWKPTITIQMLPLRDYLYGNAKTAGLVLLAAAGFLLWIACANVSNLLLARLTERDRELSIRAVLGGSRGRLIAQLMTESALLSFVACGLGVAFAWWLRRPILAFSPYRLAGLENLPFDGRVLAFAVACGVSTVILFGVIPAFRATEIRLAESVKAGEAAVIGGRGSRRVLSLIAAAEIAVLLLLSTGAGVMLKSFWKMRYQNLGFAPDHLIAATLTLSGERYREVRQRSAFVDQLLERAQNLPGIEASAITNSGEIPPGTWHATNVFLVEGRELPQPGHRPIARFQSASAGIFSILRIPLLQGRLFDASNRGNVVVVNRALVEKYFRDEKAIGRRIRFGANTAPWCEIVGVVANVKTSGLAAAPEPAVYYPYNQSDQMSNVGLILRSPLSAGAVARGLREAVLSIDSNQPVATVESLDERLTKSVSTPRFTAALLSAFAGLAAILGIIGVYGVVSCRVRWQMRELAVRQALGAQPRDVVRLVLRQGLAIIAVGIVAGLAGSLALGRVLAGMLYEVRATDPVTLIGVASLLTAVALGACWIPARRAARVDPLVLLRYE